jgi:hypothetical protein
LNRTAWRSVGSGRYLQFKLEEEETIDTVELVFNTDEGKYQRFEIQVSADGENFTKVYSGKSRSGSNGKEWESFKLDSAQKVRYIRYVGKGSNMDNQNSLVEIRFKKA